MDRTIYREIPFTPALWAVAAVLLALIAAGGGAMLFGDLSDPDSEISRRVATYATQQIRADLGLDPGVRYQNL